MEEENAKSIKIFADEIPEQEKIMATEIEFFELNIHEKKRYCSYFKNNRFA